MITKATIEDIVETIRASMGWKKSTDIDLLALAKELGFEVKSTVFDDPNVSGMVTHNQNEKTIYLNHHQHPNRQRFTLAHEIGHIVLHHDMGDALFEQVDYRRNNYAYDPKEAQANSFAASILMPKELALQAWSLLDDVDDFAQLFGVSKQAAAIRLNDLNLLDA